MSRLCSDAVSIRKGNEDQADLGRWVREADFVDDSRRDRSRVLRLFAKVVNAHDATAIEGFTTKPSIAQELNGQLDAFPISTST